MNSNICKPKNNLCHFFSFSNLEDVYSLSFPIFKKYCDQHLYTYSFYNENIEPIYKPHWNKILYAIKLLEENLDVTYFVWLDHDIIIKNLDIKVHDLIKKYDFENNKANFMMSRDPVSNINFNSGVIIFKNNLDTLNTFKKMIDMRNNPKKYPLLLEGKTPRIARIYNSNYNYQRKGVLQDTMTLFLHFNNNPEDLLHVPHRVLQSFYIINKNQYQPGDFCGHVAGPQGEELVKMMSELIEK
jgi:hypothetical protein